MTDRELLQQVLEVLTQAKQVIFNRLEVPFHPVLSMTSETIEVLRARLAQPEPTTDYDNGYLHGFDDAMEGNVTYSSPALEKLGIPQPVAWMSQGGDVSRSSKYFFEMGFTDLIPLYTAPSLREWKGLTDDEREKATGWSVEHIEARLKEKNT